MVMASEVEIIRRVSTPSLKSTPLPIQATETKQNLLSVFQNQKISGHEAAIRLILAETMASHCKEVEDGDVQVIKAIMAGIAKVIFNRAGSSSDKQLKVVFAKDQFNSSVAKYACSELAVFLDPRRIEGRIAHLSFQDLWSWAAEAHDQASQMQVFQKRNDQIKNYYLHFNGRVGGCNFKAPTWANEKNQVLNIFSSSQSVADAANRCVGFYDSGKK